MGGFVAMLIALRVDQEEADEDLNAVLEGQEVWCGSGMERACRATLVQ